MIDRYEEPNPYGNKMEGAARDERGICGQRRELQIENEQKRGQELHS